MNSAIGSMVKNYQKSYACRKNNKLMTKMMLAKLHSRVSLKLDERISLLISSRYKLQKHPKWWRLHNH